MTVIWAMSSADWVRVLRDGRVAMRLPLAEAVQLRDALTDALAISEEGEES